MGGTVLSGSWSSRRRNVGGRVAEGSVFGPAPLFVPRGRPIATDCLVPLGAAVEDVFSSRYPSRSAFPSHPKMWGADDQADPDRKKVSARLYSGARVADTKDVTTSPKYLIKTPTGYLGRRTVENCLTLDQPRAFAYVLESLADAEVTIGALGLDGEAHVEEYAR